MKFSCCGCADMRRCDGSRLAAGPRRHLSLPAKRRIIESAKREPDHRDAIVTTGREIENDIPPVVLKQAAASLLGIQATTLDGCEITGTGDTGKRFADALPPESR